MSSALEIYYAVEITEPANSTHMHNTAIAAIISEAAFHGWSGAEFCGYERRGAIVSIGMKESTAPWPGIEDLRKFREQQRAERAAADEAERQARAAEEQRQQQGSLAL